jgi:flagellar biosynthesis protein FlhF
MDLRTYRAKSLADALRLVRQELGPDATVLHTRVLGGGLWGWLAGGEIEVTASPEIQPPTEIVDVPRAELIDYRARFREQLAQSAVASSPLEELLSPSSREAEYGLSQCLDRLGRLLNNSGVEARTIARWLGRLHETARSQRLASWQALCRQLIELVAGEVACRPPLRLLAEGRRVVAVVGPTGVGKTTTLAKLAAWFRVRHEARVGLITADTFRIAAVEQLAAYAEIMNLPMEVVSTHRQMREALARLKPMELVLVDTAGRSPRDESQLSELSELLAEAQPDETLLVLTSAASWECSDAAVDAFAQVGATALVLTKVDEVSGLGPLFPCLSNRRLPVIYVADGQNVPADLRPADRWQLAQWIVGRGITQGAGNAEEDLSHGGPP